MIQQIGPHRVKHGSITLGIDDLMQGEHAYMIYSDPPWGGGNVKYWQTINKKMTGAEKQEIDFNDFLNMTFKVYEVYCENILFVEYGLRWRDEIQERGRRAGFKAGPIIPLLYAAGGKMLPLDLHTFSRGAVDFSKQYVAAVTNTHGYKTLQAAVTPFAQPGRIILDPMCGMGYTAQIAIDTGMHFRGNELNMARLQKTIDRLQR